ncbi:Retrovirus-related Pol polyprotein from transposon [Nosema granulosis]|uniref:Retrovirus-related Pol polyprotein from transposon n=1 Tax=Nosema granulosis TaxID=83296 RepID=A0A9P6KZ09_9MICR|nr:Retrovirus-related Pol polyprotein from transposon [Nosema granulosis]
MAWAIKHYDLYLKGRKFKVITDHTAHTAAKTKHIFGNMKLERMRGELQSYNFTIHYKKETELVEVDAVSRIHETPDQIRDLKLPRNVLVDSKGTWYYKVNDTETKLFPAVDERL